MKLINWDDLTGELQELRSSPGSIRTRTRRDYCNCMTQLAASACTHGQRTKKPDVSKRLTSRCNSRADPILFSPAFNSSQLEHCILSFSNLGSQSLDFTKPWSARLESPCYQQSSNVFFWDSNKHKVYSTQRKSQSQTYQSRLTAHLSYGMNPLKPVPGKEIFLSCLGQLQISLKPL